MHIPHFANCRTLFFVESIAKCRYLCRWKHIYMSIVKFSYHCNSIVNGPYPLKHMHSTQHTNEQQLNQPRLVAAFCRWWKVVITLWTLCAVSRPRWGESGIFIVTCEGRIEQHHHQQSLQQTVGTTWLNWDLTQCLSQGDFDIFSFIHIKVFAIWV